MQYAVGDRDWVINMYYVLYAKPATLPVYAISSASMPYMVNGYAMCRQSCMDLEADYRPGITFLVVQKRHHTRLFCSDSRDQSGRSGNVPAGKRHHIRLFCSDTRDQSGRPGNVPAGTEHVVRNRVGISQFQILPWAYMAHTFAKV